MKNDKRRPSQERVSDEERLAVARELFGEDAIDSLDILALYDMTAPLDALILTRRRLQEAQAELDGLRERVRMARDSVGEASEFLGPATYEIDDDIRNALRAALVALTEET